MEHLSLMCQNKAVHNLMAGMDVNAARTSISKRSHSRRSEKSTSADLQKQHTSENGHVLCLLYEFIAASIKITFNDSLLTAFEALTIVIWFP